jgi:hypothetical protein
MDCLPKPDDSVGKIAFAGANKSTYVCLAALGFYAILDYLMARACIEAFRNHVHMRARPREQASDWVSARVHYRKYSLPVGASWRRVE